MFSILVITALAAVAYGQDLAAEARVPPPSDCCPLDHFCCGTSCMPDSQMPYVRCTRPACCPDKCYEINCTRSKYAPVCGVNGVTYDNECQARCAGVKVDYEGFCQEDCCPAGHFCCQSPNGVECAPDGSKIACAAKPDCCSDPGCACPKILAPVCGFDGITYDNACLAKCAGVDVAHEGKCCCGEKERCCGNTCIPIDTVTKKPCDEPTCCEPQGCGCFKELKPVCGVDGNTYNNVCLAKCAGVEVLGEGACEKDCCPKGFFCCDGPGGKCAKDLTKPACSADPQCCPTDDCICPAIFEPVCGVDGRTYSNECEAKCANVEVLGKGECQENCCPEGFFCCDGPGGKCAPDGTKPACGIVADCCPKSDS